MTKRLIPLFILIYLLSSCAPAPAALTSTPTATVSPTRTPRPTQTLIPTATPYPSLQTDGPYLLFTYDNNNFTIMDADGSGRKHFQLPNKGYVYDLKKSVSPDGKWIAYYTGTEEEPYDLVLNLLNLSDGMTNFISNLLTNGYPENLESVTETIFFSEYDSECASDLKCKLAIIRSAFTHGLWYSIDWSPDSKSLAFAAQIDGSSSDVYIFNTADSSIRRLTNEPENIWSTDWSPDGKNILYLNSIPGTIYTSLYLRIADPTTPRTQHPKQIDGGLFWGSSGWIDNSKYLIWDGGEGAPPHNFRYLDFKTQQVKGIWKYESDGFSFLRDLGGIVVIIYPNQQDAVADSLEPGTYFVSMFGEATKLSDKIFWAYSRQSLENLFFFSDAGHLYAMSPDGTILEPITNVTESIDLNVSPNKNWFVLNKNNSQIELYSKDLQLIKSWDAESYETIWRSDSLGFFIRGNPNLYYVSVLDKNFNFVEVCPADCLVGDYVWLP